MIGDASTLQMFMVWIPKLRRGDRRNAFAEILTILHLRASLSGLCMTPATRRAPNLPRPKIETDALVDEFQCIGLLVIGVGLHDARLHHRVEEVLHPLVGALSQ